MYSLCGFYLLDLKAAQNEKKAMKSPDVSFRDGPLRHMTVRPLRFPFPHYLSMCLLLVLCAVAVMASGATAQSSEDVIYFIEVAVTVTGPRQNEQSIRDLLKPVFETQLQTTCAPPVFTTTTAITSTTANNRTTTTNDITTIVNTTTAMTSTTIATPANTTMTTNSSTAATSVLSTSQRTTTSITNVTTSAAKTTDTSASTNTSATTIVLSTSPSTSTSSTKVATSAIATTDTSATRSSAIAASTSAAATTGETTTSMSAGAKTILSTTTEQLTPATISSSSDTAIIQSTSSSISRIEKTTTNSPTNTLVTADPSLVTTDPSLVTVDPSLVTADPSLVVTETKQPNHKPNSNSGKVKRAAQATRDNATGLFSNFEVDCVNKTSIKNTVCYVSLELKESVDLCCILQAFCSASKSESNTTTNIQVVGKNAMRTGSPCGNLDAGVVCNYTGQTSPNCDDSAYEIQPRNLTCSAENKCNCSTYCSKADAYYTFNITTETPLNIESILPDQLSIMKTECPFCPPEITSNYKNASVICDRASCTVVAVFTKEVSICSLSTLIQTLLGSNNMSMNGLLTRVAICGKPVTEESAALLLQSSYRFVDVNLTAEEFCTATEASHIHTCQPEERVIAILNEKCFLTTTTVTPNTTFVLPNTTVSVNETMNTTATAATNATSTANPATDDNLAAANALLSMTKDASRLNSSQIEKLVSDLEKLLSGPNISVALGDTSVNIVSNLQNASLEAVQPSKNRIIGIVDTVGVKLIVGEKPESILSDAVALSVKKADGTQFEEVNFSITNPSNLQIRGPRATRALKEDSTVPQGSVRLPRTLTENLPTEIRQMVSRVQFNFYQKSTLFQDRDLRDRILNSGIIGSSVGNLSLSNLPDAVVITLRHTQPTPVNYTATCVFWDFTSNDGSGGWNSRGCSVQNSTNTETICGCNHLTSFGILLDPSRETITSRVHATILTFITYIGCGVSAIFLAVTLLTYLAFGKLRKDIPSKILIQLCLALLLLNLVFLVDAWLALFPDAVGLCICTAWFLHYFLLVTFTWMGLEAVHMYIALVKVFNSYISRYMVKFSLAGWGIPMIVVIIVIAIDKDNYGLVSYGKFSDGTSDDFCWIKNDVAFYVAVVAYFCVIFLFNVIMFIIVLVQLCRLKRQNPQNLQHRTTFQDVRSVVGITILLGLSWGFAFFAWGPLNLPFMYLFAIFNSLYGFFIFVFHCAIKENVRRQWRTYLCCGRMRLAENSEWSRTATQKTAKKSSMTRITSLQSSKSNNSSSSSSYLVSDSSDQMNSYGGPFPDRIITADEDPRMDVVLNEINSQYRRL